MDQQPGGSSDDEHTLVEPTGPQWREFEKSVAQLVHELDGSAQVQHDVKLVGAVSGRQRQVDVLVTGVLGGEDFLLAIECKRYAKPVGIGAVDEFVGKLLDLNVDSGALYAMNGFGAGAEARAKSAIHPRVRLRDLAEARPEPWSEGLPEFRDGDCPVESCHVGNVGWREWVQEDGSELLAGICWSCGAWVVYCPNCGERTVIDDDEEQCYSCDRVYRLEWDRDRAEVERVLDVSPDA